MTTCAQSWIKYNEPKLELYNKHEPLIKIRFGLDISHIPLQTQGGSLKTVWFWKKCETLNEIVTALDVEWIGQDQINWSTYDILERGPDMRDDWGLNAKYNADHTCGGHWWERGLNYYAWRW